VDDERKATGLFPLLPQDRPEIKEGAGVGDGRISRTRESTWWNLAPRIAAARESSIPLPGYEDAVESPRIKASHGKGILLGPPLERVTCARRRRTASEAVPRSVQET
jgi:hypothetical protein